MTTNEQLYLRTKGVLPIQKIKLLYQLGVIKTPAEFPLLEGQFQPNSLDLRLGTIAHRVRCSFLPENETVEEKLAKLTQHSFSIDDGAVLEPNCTYIIPLLEEIHFPDNSVFSQFKKGRGKGGEESHIFTEEKLSARTNPKSSTGRLDIFTRVITDYSHRFEEIVPGYSGKLYLEVVPKSFPIRVRTGQRLNQLRIRHGFSLLSDEDILRTHHSDPFLFNDGGKPVHIDDLKVNNGLFMSVSLQNQKGQIVGYKAKKNRDLIDLDSINHYKVSEFWDPIFMNQDDYLILEPEAFYIFASKERCRIPSHLAAEMVPYDTGSGELRTHYAGFFDSGFGGLKSEGGARAVLEVRSHDVPFLIEDGQTFFRMVFEPNTEIPELIYGRDIKSNYQGQDLKLSKHFIDTE
ncbi:MAG TPA: 2'-deoxycytidine 5'-triphosphate deaminase [Bacteroidetes bacterium]|nr:2'-deoxycytidine 5'-triphosphate deaminase [Bacteroidota bacterium]